MRSPLRMLAPKISTSKELRSALKLKPARYFAGRLAGGTTPFMRKYSTICP